MSSREEILKRLHDNVKERFPMPEIAINGIKYDDPVDQFINACTSISGAKVCLSPFPAPPGGSDLNRSFSRKLCESGKPMTSPPRGNEGGFTVRGDIAVAENGCIWIPQREDDRSFLFKSEHLNIIVSRKDVVNNMHEAYERIAASEDYFKIYKFGTFISGPSKTADIEGALVYGAQAARSVTVYIEK